MYTNDKVSINESRSIPGYLKLIYVIIGMICLYGIVELFSLAAFSLISKKAFSFSDVYARRQNVICQDDSRPMREFNTPGIDAFEVLHPYLGYVSNPQENTQQRKKDRGGVVFSDYGFIDNASPLRDHSPDNIVLGVFGGSVAYYFSVYGTNALIQRLQLSPAFRGQTISIVRVALGGYKQPQQLIALAYLLSLGAHFDVLINLDGFNEVVLPPTENMPKGVFPFFPRRWFFRVSQIPSFQMRVLMGKIAWIDNQRRYLARVFHHRPMRFSVTMNIAWLGLDSALSQKMYDAQTSLAGIRPDEGRYEITGPAYPLAIDDEFYKNLAAQWKKSSIQMFHLCQGNDIEYWHFLQPCQYDIGSKPMGEEEKRIAFAPNHIYRKHIERGYPFLRQAGEQLVAQGVPFHDFSRIFKDTTDRMYEDNVCHLNIEGLAIMGRAIADVIIAEHGSNKQP